MKPETTAILITRTDGRIRIMQFVTKGALNAAGEVFEREATAEAIEAEISKAGFTDTVSWRVIDPSEIPDDRTFRDAWIDAGKIDVDMPKARAIHRQSLRDMRAPLLAALDVAYQRADEMDDAAEKARVAAKKQALRDVTSDPAIEAAKTPDELKSALPNVLYDPAVAPRLSR